MAAEKERINSSEVDNRLDDIFGDEHERTETPDYKGDTSTADEVNKKLDAFFGEDDDDVGGFQTSIPEKVEPRTPKPKIKSEPPSQPYTYQQAEPTIFDELKSTILSLEWEITDELMQRLEDEAKKLEEVKKDDKIVVALLQLINYLGKYIRKKKADAHPESFTLLHSVYENLEKILTYTDLSDNEKKKMLVTEVNKYKELKKILASKPEPVKRREEPEPEYHDETPPSSEMEITHQEASDSQSQEAMIPPFSFFGQDESRDDMHGIPGMVPEFYFKQLISVIEALNQTIQMELSSLREEIRSWREKD